MANQRYVAYIKKNSLSIPPSAISLELESQIHKILETRPFKIEKDASSVKISGIEFNPGECPIIFVGKNHDHGLAYDIFKEYLKQKKPKKVIMDLRDYHSDAFEEHTGKSWSWARKLAKDYPEINQIKVYNCKEYSNNGDKLLKKISISPDLPKERELKELKQNAKQRIITSLDTDFLYLNNFERKDFKKIIGSLDYPRDYMDIYLFNCDKNSLDDFQNDFIVSLLKHLANKK
ncbi:MAG: hypothetical protein N3G19_00115 [Candidatus Pacearchaeota archaeon]|nr:hypothetical protein [Candidatus Pacearchaeota archaeon]